MHKGIDALSVMLHDRAQCKNGVACYVRFAVKHWVRVGLYPLKPSQIPMYTVTGSRSPAGGPSLV